MSPEKSAGPRCSGNILATLDPEVPSCKLQLLSELASQVSKTLREMESEVRRAVRGDIFSTDG